MNPWERGADSYVNGDRQGMRNVQWIKSVIHQPVYEFNNLESSADRPGTMNENGQGLTMN